jgi:methionine synthase II (cobalamin-independent)
MAIVTNYICDKCGNSQTNPGQFWALRVNVVDANYSTSREWKSMNVCRPCLESFGIYAQEETKKSPDYNPPETVEDLIRKILDIVGENDGNTP